MKYLAGVLVLLIYIPILILYLKKDFRTRFGEISSKKFVDLAVELSAGILYAIIIVFAFFSDIVSGAPYFVGILFYMTGLILAWRGYFVFYNNKNLITKDIFRASRNPTYFFGFVAIFGVALMLLNWEILVLLALLFVLTNKIVMNEEKIMTKKYGKKYLDYKRKVRRWV